MRLALLYASIALDVVCTTNLRNSNKNEILESRRILE
jgi:hypothetical protein